MVGALALLLSSLPYLAGYLAQTTDRVFDGGLVVLPDYHTHLSEMQLGLRGEWLHRLLTTHEDQQGTLLRTLYIGLGHAARVLNLSLPLTYHVGRVVLGALFLWAAYRFIAVQAQRADVRRWAFALVAFSSGVGWLAQIVAPAGPDGISPIDFWLIDANSFLSIFVFPHFAAAMALLLELFTRLTRQLDSEVSTPGEAHEPFRVGLLVTALYAFLLVTIHPYAIAIVAAPAVAFAGVSALLRRGMPAGWWMHLAAIIAGGAPALAYQAIVFFSDPIFNSWAAQNFTPSPPPIYYVLGFGPVLALALLGLRRYVRDQGRRAALVLTWFGVVAVLIYLPVGIQRRFIEGLHVPLCVIAAYGLIVLAGRLWARARFVAIHLLLAFASLSTVYLIIGYSSAALARSERFFHAGDLIAAIDWLGENSAWDDTALAAESTGSLIAARIGHRVVLGHWAETVDYAHRLRDVAAFFDGQTPDVQRLAMLSQFGIRFVVHGEAERVLGDFDPAQADYLEAVYHSGGVTILETVID